MNTKYNSSMSFRFECNKVEYTHSGKSNTVTGETVRDPIKYTADRVDRFLKNGEWRVLQLLDEAFLFPRPGVYAKFEKMKVFVVGRSSHGTNMWVVENMTSSSMMRVKQNGLSVIEAIDDQAFEMAKDLLITYDQALKMINKGYGKV